MGRVKVKHIHMLYALHDKFVKVWRCKDPLCSFRVHMSQEKQIILHRASLCTQCSDVFSMDEQSLTEEWPICQRCRFKNQGINIDAVTKEIERLTTNENITAYTKIDLSKPLTEPETEPSAIKSKKKVEDEVIIDSPTELNESENESNSISPVQSSISGQSGQTIKDRILIDPFAQSED